MSRRAVLLFLLLGAVCVVMYLGLGFPKKHAVPSAPSPAPSSTPMDQLPESSGAFAVVLDKNAAYEDRVAAVRNLPKVLPPADVEKLRALVNTPGVHATIKNDALVYILSQQAKSPDLGKDLVKMYRTDKDDTWRDYCLQFMCLVHPFASNQKELEDTLFAIAEKPSGKDDHFSGTALLSLKTLEKTNPRVARRTEALARKAVLANDDPEKSVTAINISRESGDPAILPRVRELAVDSKTLVRLRLSAIGTVAELGDASDLPLLQKLCADPDDRVRRVAKYQLTALEARLKTAKAETGGTT